MVKIAVAGGTGNVATELLRTPLASGNHTFTILTRSDPPSPPHPPNTTYKKISYTPDSLTRALQNHTICLSFLVIMDTPGFLAQKALIDACISAGVKRFAPSEWGVKNYNEMPPYKNKDLTVEYLEELESEGRGIQYCLFQPSIWMDYFAHPGPLSKGLITWPFFVDLENRRAMVLDGGGQAIVVTAIADVSRLLARALDDEGSWPVVGGMRGSRTSINELVALGKRIRGGEWLIENVKSEDLEKGVLKSSWVPLMTHPAIPEEVREAFSREFVIMFLKGVGNGSWDVGDEWNRRYPDFEWTGVEKYLEEAWKGRE